jgi:hypothetical protein
MICWIRQALLCASSLPRLLLRSGPSLRILSVFEGLAEMYKDRVLCARIDIDDAQPVRGGSGSGAAGILVGWALQLGHTIVWSYEMYKGRVLCARIDIDDAQPVRGAGQRGAPLGVSMEGSRLYASALGGKGVVKVISVQACL